MCIDRWGPVVLPTIEEIIKMIEEQAVKYGWENIVLWKVDLHGAFHLMDIHPDDVTLMAMELRNGMVAYFLSGFFGWTGFPIAFGVISRCLCRRIASRITGRLVIFA
jgi:hypothetical protein